MTKNCGHGLANSTKFDNLHKIGMIPLLIKDEGCKVSCANKAIFAGNVIWIVKHHTDMSYRQWNDVPKEVKEKLRNHVRVREKIFNAINWM